MSPRNPLNGVPENRALLCGEIWKRVGKSFSIRLLVVSALATSAVSMGGCLPPRSTVPSNSTSLQQEATSKNNADSQKAYRSGIESREQEASPEADQPARMQTQKSGITWQGSPANDDLETIAPFTLAGLTSVSGHSGAVLALRPLRQRGKTQPSQVLSVDSEGVVFIWELAASQAYALRKLGLPGIVSQAVFSLSGQYVAAAIGAKVWIFDLLHETPPFALSRIKGRISELLFDRSGESLLIGSADGRGYRWRFIDERDDPTLYRSGESLERYLGANSPIQALATHPGNRIFFSGDWSGGIHAWLILTADQVRVRSNDILGGQFLLAKNTKVAFTGTDRTGIEQLAVTANGEKCIVGFASGEIGIWNVKGVKKILRQPVHRGLLVALGIDSLGSVVVSAGRDGVVMVNSLDEATPFKELTRFAIAGVKVIEVLSPSHFFVGTQAGKILEINL